MAPPLVRLFGPPIVAPPPKTVRKLSKKCDNLLCRKVNSPQAVEGKYACLHCEKGTYRITPKEAADSTNWTLLKHERDFKEGEVEAKGVRGAQAHKRRLEDDKLVEERQKRKAEEKRLAEEEQRRAEEEQRRAEQAKQQFEELQCEEYGRLERLHDARQRIANARKVEEEGRQQREAAAREARQQREAAAQEAHRAHEEAGRQLRAQQEVVQRHQAELEKMVSDARTQERRNKQNASPPNLERRRAQRRHVESPPPNRGHHSARDPYASKPCGPSSSHNVNPPPVRDHRHASRPSGSGSAHNVNLPAVRDYHAPKPSGFTSSHNVNPPAVRDHHYASRTSGPGSAHNVNPPTVRDHRHAPKPSGSRSAPGVDLPAPRRPPRPPALFPHVQLDDTPFQLKRYPAYF